jgi:hypothetical protein
MRNMKITELEKIVIERMLVDRTLKPVKLAVDFDRVSIRDREFTGAGFLTEFERSEELKLFDDKTSLRWGKVGARLNASEIETGYLIYVDDGFLTTIEGYTYGEEWPHQIEQIDLYELKAGEELISSPR